MKSVSTIDLRCEDLKIAPGILRMGGSNPNGDRISFTNYYMEFNGKPWLPVMGEFHYSRFPCRYWEEELLKMKAGGIQIVATYAFWNHHEEEQGVFSFDGNLNLRTFVELCGKHGLWTWLRIGPFCHGEARNGGLPDWLYGQPFEIRSNDERYLSLVRCLYGEYAQQINGLLFKDGGPVIGIQLENEFMLSGAPWETTHNSYMEWTATGSGGEEHLLNLKRIAIEAGMDVPVYSCTAWGSPVPEGELLPIIGGGYAFHAWEDDPSAQKPTENYLFRNLHDKGKQPYDESKIPYAGCETGGGMQVFYKNRPLVPPESVEAVSVIQMGSGANVMGFYVYHGGSHPVGRHSFMNEHRCPRISYDFQAPLREFGQVAESYKRLKRHFLFLNEFGGMLAPKATVLPANAKGILPQDSDTLRFAARISDGSGFVFLNNYQDHHEMKDMPGLRLELKLADETLTLPSTGSFTLHKSASAILPFNISLDGAILKWATCQLLTRLDSEDTVTYFFFAPNGIPPEYALELSSIADLNLKEASARNEDCNVIVSVNPGTACVIEMTNLAGHHIRIVTLTEEQSLGFWKARLGCKELVLLSDAELIFKGDTADMVKTVDPSMWISVFPSPDSCVLSGKSALNPQEDGIFRKYSLIGEEKEIGLNIERIGTDKALVNFTEGVMDGINDLFLRIEYDGDIAGAYIGGKLIHDNFWNGTAWEIGLKRFMPELLRKGILIKIIPRKTGDHPQVHFTEMAAIKVKDNMANASALLSITAVPEYRRIVRFANCRESGKERSILKNIFSFNEKNINTERDKNESS